MRSSVAALLWIAFVLAAPITRAADEPDSRPPPAEVSGSEAQRRITAFDKALKAAAKIEKPADRTQAEAAALAALSAAAHERVAQRLAEAAADEDLLGVTRNAALDAFVAEGVHARGHTRRVEKWLVREVHKEIERLDAGDIGVPLDPETGDPVADTPEAQRRIGAGRARAGLLCAGVRTLRVLDHVPEDPAMILKPLLRSPFDVLALEAIASARAWNVRALGGVLGMLLRMYPEAHRWETVGVADLGDGTTTVVKAAWMKAFGHPLKRRARPAVHQAVFDLAKAWSGREFRKPRDAERWLSRQR